jgi:diketogulonate reductase-like aldo/keto reductase
MKMKTIRLPDGQEVPALGQGTWRMGEDNAQRSDEVAALRHGIELGMTLIDTAEMYGEGEAEKIVAEAIAGQHDRVFVVTKAYPHHASQTELPRACERSLKRLRIDAIDLYLLHWRGSVPLGETAEAFEKLRSSGKIRRWGVSNFDLHDMEELAGAVGMFSVKSSRATERGRPNQLARSCSANQVLYNLQNRGIEFDLLPWSGKQRIPIMAYSPLGRGRALLENPTLGKVADCHQRTPAQIALAWVLRLPNVIAIPKAAKRKHVRDNADTTEICLTKQDWIELDHAFPPPASSQPLATL